MTEPDASQHQAAGAVLFVVDGLGLSGKTKALVDLACGLHPRRYRATVCSLTAEDTPLTDQLRARNVPLYEISCRDGLQFGMIWRLARLMRRIRPDVVHCYNPRPMLYAGLAARLAGVPGAVGSLSAFACQVPDRQYSHLPQPLVTSSWRNRWRNRLLLRLVRYLVAVSRPLGERFFTYNRLPLDKLRIIPYGRLVEQKDYPTLLRAVALARREVPGLRLVVAGDGPLRRPLEQLAGEVGIADRVVFLGHCVQVAPVLHGFDLFVLASVFEPFGVALLEAKAAGLAIVATKVNEVPHLLRDGASGLLVPPGDPERLAETLVRLARDPALRRQLGQAALAEMQADFRLPKVVDAYQQLYDCVRGLAPAE